MSVGDGKTEDSSGIICSSNITFTGITSSNATILQTKSIDTHNGLLDRVITVLTDLVADLTQDALFTPYQRLLKPFFSIYRKTKVRHIEAKNNFSSKNYQEFNV